ncbi:putative ribonuclease H protein [Trifolium medium]|uniref:Putative ribonuclease H protein n=1 Tax=Trifolium medium TaxID=97028 RepID=A0A392Q5C5_9FABA|nr:putative ribonuclease H protein [Trifolium medium]
MWRRLLFALEEDQLKELEELIASVVIFPRHEDKWIWKYDICAGFSVRSAYNQLQFFMMQNRCDDGLAGVFKLFWSCSVPSKFIIHGWFILLDRVATKDALVAKGDTLCVFCDAAVEEMYLG